MQCQRCKDFFLPAHIETTATCPRCGQVMKEELPQAVTDFLRTNYPMMNLASSNIDKTSALLYIKCSKCETTITIDATYIYSWSSLATGLLRGTIEKHVITCANQRPIEKPKEIMSYDTSGNRRIRLE